MESVFEKISEKLKSFIDKQILAVSIDDLYMDAVKECTLFGDEIKIYFSGNLLLQITTDDNPHFYGEGDLELEIKNDSCQSEPLLIFKEKKISEIKIFVWKDRGVLLFKPAVYFVQIEFYHNNKLLLSTGFFHYNQSTNKMEFLGNGELSANCMKGLSTLVFDKNIYVETIPNNS